ncbi:hypothetical protein Btru_044883 [Bulinus truncatus]|nr:hypothetical protein Btru_044883 [Bulinus truncatus]
MYSLSGSSRPDGCSSTERADRKDKSCYSLHLHCESSVLPLSHQVHAEEEKSSRNINHHPGTSALIYEKESITVNESPAGRVHQDSHLAHLAGRERSTPSALGNTLVCFTYNRLKQVELPLVVTPFSLIARHSTYRTP